MPIRAVTNTDGSTDYLQGTSSSLSISDTDSFIVGGWIDNWVVAPASFGTIAVDFDTALSYLGFILYVSDTGVLEFDTIDDFLNPVTPISGKTFIVAWIDRSINQMTLAANGVVLDTKTFTPSSFSASSGTLSFFTEFYNPTNTPLSAVLDNWFFCKNPVDMSIAISTIHSSIYNSGNGKNYDSLTPTEKSDIGLVGWWGFDESGDNTRFDSQGTNDLSTIGAIDDTSPLAGLLFLDLNESLTLADDNEDILNKILTETTFIFDDLRTFPRLKFLQDNIRLSDWVSIKRTRSEWFD